MPRRSLGLAPLALAVALAASIAAPSAGAEDLNCGAYAAAAIAQNDQQQMLACGFTGGRWSSDFNAHFAWCRTATMALLTQEDAARKAALQQCAAKPAQDQQACQAYAQEAVAQQNANRQRGCGLGGGAWSDDYGGHFQWCLGTSPEARAAQQQGRDQQLAGCVAAQQAAQAQAGKDACARYAAGAVAQQKENVERRCGFDGGRWSEDWFAHFRWCETSGLPSAQQEEGVRRVALDQECSHTVCEDRRVATWAPPFFKIERVCRTVRN